MRPCCAGTKPDRPTSPAHAAPPRRPSEPQALCTRWRLRESLTHSSLSSEPPLGDGGGALLQCYCRPQLTLDLTLGHPLCWPQCPGTVAFLPLPLVLGWSQTKAPLQSGQLASALSGVAQALAGPGEGTRPSSFSLEPCPAPARESGTSPLCLGSAPRAPRTMAALAGWALPGRQPVSHLLPTLFPRPVLEGWGPAEPSRPLALTRCPGSSPRACPSWAENLGARALARDGQGGLSGQGTRPQSHPSGHGVGVWHRASVCTAGWCPRGGVACPRVATSPAHPQALPCSVDVSRGPRTGFQSWRDPREALATHQAPPGRAGRDPGGLHC